MNFIRLGSGLFFSALLVLAFTGCEDAEVKDMAQAQQCLDAVPASAPQDAENCFAYVSAYDSQQANILKCSIKITSGGLSTQKIAEAYKAADSSTLTNKEAVYIAYLALDKPNASGGYSLAQQAYPFCVKSQVSGLIFIAGLVQTASMIASVTGATFDLNNPAAAQTAINTALQNCIAGAGCNMNEVGTTLATLSTVYCASPSSDLGVCTDVNSAITEYGGDTTKTAQAFMCKLQKKTFDGTNCT
ncbi:MAG: hypothetical protein GW917_02720 [Bdellovibrionales bacterium]|nr:hypothetical protein [Bdellovibrionales bacterium]